MVRVFAEGDLSTFISQTLGAMHKEVRSERENKILNVDATQYVDYLILRYSIEPLQFHWDAMSVDQTERAIPAEQHGFGWNVRPGKSYPRQVVVYRIPFSGSSDLIRLKPSTWVMWTDDMNVSNSTIAFEIVNLNMTSQAIRSRADQVVQNLRKQAEYSRKDVEEYNRSLPGIAKSSLEGRREELLKRRDLLHELGVPVQKSTSVPETFSVDAPRRKIITKPEAPSSAFKPEPTLPVDAYEHILEVIRHVGGEMERHPATYSGKNEETLRDFLLMSLAPNFESATGETFNKKGKTDILVRHEGSNVFVAECAIWKGQKNYLDKIDQALGYLTWRDSKAAIVVFARNKIIQRVLDAVVRSTPTHAQWNHTFDDSADGLYRYGFSLPDDASRGLRLAVMVFHLPDE